MRAATLIAGLILCGCLSSLPARAQWDRYWAIMWVDNLPSTPEAQQLYFQRLQEMGCNAGMVYPGDDAGPYVESGFPFYVENLTRGLYIGDTPEFKEAYARYKETRDPGYLVRIPCLNDPAYLQQQRERIRQNVERYRDARPLVYNIRDEPSANSFISPFDLDFGPLALAAFREWLRSQYADLAALNAQWETSFATWDDVRPMTTWEIKEREKAALAQGRLENYAPWCDHRAFMDISFARAVEAFAGDIREFDPTGLAGLEGLQMPAAFGGYDLWRLSQVIDWLEPYDIGNSRAIFGAFCPDKPIFSTIFPTEPRRLERHLWRLALEGDAGVIIWHGKDCIDTSLPDLALTEYAKALSVPLKELTGEVGAMLRRAKRQHDPIAIHYSQPSIQVDWMIESRADGDTWINRLSSWEPRVNEMVMARSGLVQIIEDLGLQPTFISSDQIKGGGLAAQGIKVLFLVRSLAISAEEAEAIRSFVESGGIVVADGWCALFDEHGKRLERGALDDLFGLSQGPPIPGPSDTMTRVGLPELRSHVGGLDEQTRWNGAQVGRGRAYLLNADFGAYERQRLHPPQGAGARDLLRRILEPTGVVSPVRILDAHTGQLAGCVEVQRLVDGATTYIGFMRNPQTEAREGLDPDTENLEIEKPLRIRIELAGDGSEPRFVRQPGDGKIIGRAVEVTLEPWVPVILATT